MITLLLGLCALSWVLNSQLDWILGKLKIEREVCLKCFTFWFVLILTLNPIIASMCAFINFLVDVYIINKIEIKL